VAYFFIERGIKYLFPIQTKTFDLIYEGKDVIGKASKLD
jgi:superfamily II DNA/RNA helicase